MYFVDLILIVMLVTVFWLVIGLQVKLKLTRDELLSMQYRVLDLEKANRSAPAVADTASQGPVSNTSTLK